MKKLITVSLISAAIGGTIWALPAPQSIEPATATVNYLKPQAAAPVTALTPSPVKVAPNYTYPTVPSYTAPSYSYSPAPSANLPYQNYQYNNQTTPTWNPSTTAVPSYPKNPCAYC